jgi:hypothetical protein
VSENQLRLLILRIADALEKDEDFDIDQALVAIEQAKGSLEMTYQSYQRTCPPEAKVASEAMTDSVALFYGALSNLEEFIDSCDDALLVQVRNEVDVASQLLERALDWAQSVAESNNPNQLY